MSSPAQRLIERNELLQKSIVSVVLSSKKSLPDLLTDDELRIRIQFFGVYLLFSIVSLGMTVVNVLTGFEYLMLSTLIFGILNVFNIALCLINKQLEMVARYIFSVEVLILFIFFIVVGEPEGFSAFWIALLPACGMLLFRMKYGTILSLIQFAIVVFFFWTPIGRSLLLYDYSDSFLLRFPLLYFAFYSVGLFFEYIRSNTQKELVDTRERYKFLSSHDSLSGLYNRIGFNSVVNNNIGNSDNGYGFAIIDIDHFKRVNDTYGHQSGDIALQHIAVVASDVVDKEGVVGRWGGEEFSIFFYNQDNAETICNQIIDTVRSKNFHLITNTISLTVSIGLVLVDKTSTANYSELLSVADENLYKSKENGRNQLTVSRLS